VSTPYYQRFRLVFARLDRRTVRVISVVLVIVILSLVYAYKNSGGNDTSEEVTNAPPAVRSVAPLPITPASPVTPTPATTSPQQ
jgi:hypothetical protein